MDRVLVLLASHNGKHWLMEQVESILAQQSVQVSILISDDFSHDGTAELANRLAADNTAITTLPSRFKFGSAGRNFYHLIVETDLDYDYFAFSDQDDIWQPDKLMRHIALAKEHRADGVSSSVTAFWSDGRTLRIEKSQPQRRFDYVFESAGPGCTFLMTPWLIQQVRNQLNDDKSAANSVTLHDWLTYAICRHNGRVWIIDDDSSMYYRQHNANVIGANSGFKAKLSRLLKLKDGWYRTEVIKICQVCRLISDHSNIKTLERRLTSPTIFSQLCLLSYVDGARRKLSDRLFLFLAILFFIF